jgi:hypothetical protein
MLPDVRKLFRLLAGSSAIVVFLTLLYYQYSTNASAARQAVKPTVAEEFAEFAKLVNDRKAEKSGDVEQVEYNSDQKPVDAVPQHVVESINVPSESVKPPPEDANQDSTGSIVFSADRPGPDGHPIEDLVGVADIHFGALLSKEKYGVREAAAAYRTSRGRHPPPGWGKYIEWCEKNKVVLIEDFFDPLYRDLAPFWNVSTHTMRSFPQSWHRTLSIRNGELQLLQDGMVNMAGWLHLWYDAVGSLPVGDLPDVDLAFNLDDEPKLFASYETVQNAVAAAEAERREYLHTPLGEISDESTRLPAFNEDWRSASGIHAPYRWSDRSSETPLWDVVRDICPPQSLGSNAVAEKDFTQRMDWTPMSNAPHLHKGFVKDWKHSKSACANPDLRNIHGSFVAMKSSSLETPKDHDKQWDIIEELVPLLSGSKISGVNSDILVPPAIEFKTVNNSREANYDFDIQKAKPWSSKETRFLWRGNANGGIHTEDNWTRFHRHRLVAMLNSSLVEEHYRVREAGQQLPQVVPGGDPALSYNFPMPSAQDVHSLAHMSATKPANAIKSWLNSLYPKAGTCYAGR